ncbi:MAG: hypothetical protein ACRET7_07535 [Burkholderiales bacterium]
MLLVVLLLAVGIGLFAYGALDSVALSQQQDAKIRLAFVQVRDALIGWSVARTTTGPLPNARPGELPCPDMDNDGFEDGSCVAGAIGRVPWKTLGIPEPKDEAGETLWYTIAGPFRIWSMNGTVINSDTKGDITVYLDSTATTMTTEAVAVIFAPGGAFGAQNRGCTVGVNCNATGQCTTSPASLTPKCNPTNYLETTGGANNATTNGPFIQAQRSDTFNDRLLVITTSDLIPPVEQRVARELRPILQDYKANTACVCTTPLGTTGCYPWADLSNGYSDSDPYNAGEGRNRGRIPAFGAGPYDWGSNPCGTALRTLPSWFVTNDWRLVVYYTAGQNFLGPAACTTCVDSTLTVDGVSNKQVVILMPGPLLGASPRAPVALDDLTYWSWYFKDAENQDNGNDWFVTPTSTAFTRDRIYTIP